MKNAFRIVALIKVHPDRLVTLPFLPVIFTFLLFSTIADARNSENDSIINPVTTKKSAVYVNESQNPVCKSCISPFVEFLGKGFLSLNLDYRINDTYAISIGVAGIEEGTSPNVMGYYFTGKSHRLEIGGGISGNFKDRGFSNIFVHGVIGYRYQKKKGILFRAGFTPMVVFPCTDESKTAVIPWAGISIGYSF